jgi:hypothetical protein
MKTPPKPDLEALLKEHDEAVKAAVDDGEGETYFSKGVEQEEQELEDQTQRITRELDEQTSASDRRIQLLEEQLRETNDLVKRLADKSPDLDAMVADEMERQREHFNRIRYKRIINNGGWCVIQMHTHEEAGRNYPVHVAVNGQVWNLPRGVPVRVPVCVVEALDHAHVDTLIKEVDGEGNPHLRHYDFLYYPYSMLDETGRQVVPQRGSFVRAA